MTAKKERPIPATYADILTELREIRDANAKLAKRIKDAEGRRDVLMAAAHLHPESKGTVISKAAGVSTARVSQVAPARATRAAVKEAQRAGVLGDTEAPAAPPRQRKAPTIAAKLAAAVGTPPTAPEGEPKIPGAVKYAERMDMAAKRELPGLGSTPVTIENGAASSRKWVPQKGRLTAVVHPDGRAMVRGAKVRVPLPDQSAASYIGAVPADVERIVITGPRPWHTDRETTMQADVNEWLTAPVPGWVPGSHFPDDRNPVGRWQHKESGRRVEIQHIGAWQVRDDAAPDVVFHAFAMLHKALRQRWGSDSVEILSSPTTLGMDLWARSIPRNTEYPLMSQELRELIRTTSGQGRFELFTPPSVPETLPGVVYLDCVFSYSALTWGMPVGAPFHVTGKAFADSDADAQSRLMRGRGRWHVRVTVPDGWTHVGILPCSGANGWEYPREPGRKFTTWASGSEVWLARENGWHVEVIDGITWKEGKPLDLWKQRLTECWQAFGAMESTCDGITREAARIAGRMVRAIVLLTIGGFHSRGGQRKGIAASEAAIPATAVRAQETENGAWQWEAGRSGAALHPHPEWSAEIYGRQRVRLLSGPHGSGVLSGRVLPEHVVAFRADGVILTTDPGWFTEEKPGQFRIKGRLGARPAPTSEGELLALRDESEAAL